MMTGTELRGRRKALRYTVRALAARWGVHANTITTWEHDHYPVPAWVDDALIGIAARAGEEWHSAFMQPPRLLAIEE